MISGKAPYFSLLLHLPGKLSCTLRVCMESSGAYQHTVYIHISVVLSKGKTLPSIIHLSTSTQCKICGLKFSLKAGMWHTMLGYFNSTSQENWSRRYQKISSVHSQNDTVCKHFKQNNHM
jgi:hypothetical protein